MSNPINAEHFEAQQVDANARRASFIESLSKEDQAKFKAIDKAIAILTKADIAFYMFTYLPFVENPRKNVMWQWNSVSEMGFKDGKLDETFMSDVNCSMLGSMYATFTGYGNIGYKGIDDPQEKYEKFCAEHLPYALSRAAKCWDNDDDSND